MIPKIIHYCWLSGEPYPEKVQTCIESWKQVLPDYEIWLWDADRFHIQSIPWVYEAVKAEKYAFASDYIRFYALYHFGGIYLDSDVEVLKSFDGLLNQKFFFGFEYSGQPEAAVIGAVQHLKWLRRCMEWYENHDFGTFITSKKQIVAPTIFRHGFEKTYHARLMDNGKVQSIHSGSIFPYQYFSPKNGFTGKICMTGKTYAVHHFHAAWLGNLSVGVQMRRWIHAAMLKCMGRRHYNQVMYGIRKVLHRT